MYSFHGIGSHLSQNHSNKWWSMVNPELIIFLHSHLVKLSVLRESWFQFSLPSFACVYPDDFGSEGGSSKYGKVPSSSGEICLRACTWTLFLAGCTCSSNLNTNLERKSSVSSGMFHISARCPFATKASSLCHSLHQIINENHLFPFHEQTFFLAIQDSKICAR